MADTTTADSDFWSWDNAVNSLSGLYDTYSKAQTAETNLELQRIQGQTQLANAQTILAAARTPPQPVQVAREVSPSPAPSGGTAVTIGGQTSQGFDIKALIIPALLFVVAMVKS